MLTNQRMNCDNNIMTSIETSISLVCSSLRKVETRIDNLKKKVFELSIKEDDIVSLGDSKLITFSEHLSEMNNAVENVGKSVTTCEALIELCFKDLTHSLFWLPEDKKNLEVVFIEGNDPWSFWVTYRNSTMLESLQKILETKHQEGSLKPFTSCPEIGTFVCCNDRQVFFRGLVIGTLPDGRFKIMGVDTKCIKIVKLENIYEITQDLCCFHAHAVHCCLSKESDVQHLWDDDLSAVFKSTLRECKLVISVISEIECFPPKFLVEMKGYNEPMRASINLSDWICGRLLPEIQKAVHDCNDDILSLLSEKALDPYSVMEDGAESTTFEGPNYNYNLKESNSDTLKNNFSKVSVFDSEKNVEKSYSKEENSIVTSNLKEGASEFIPSNNQNLYVMYPNRSLPGNIVNYANFYNAGTSPSFNGYSGQCSYPYARHANYPQNYNHYGPNQWYPNNFGQENNSYNETYFRPFTEMKRLPVTEPLISKNRGITSITNNQKEQDLLENDKEESEHNEEVNSEHNEIKSNVELKDPSTEKESPKETLFSGDIKERKDEVETLMKNSNIIINQAIDNQEHAESILQQHVINEEEACVSAVYHPTDEIRICQFYAKRGYCWKVGCNKDHSNPSYGSVLCRLWNHGKSFPQPTKIEKNFTRVFAPSIPGSFMFPC